MDVKMLLATLPDDVKLAPWCRRLGISRQTAYKWRARYRLEGVAGLEERSRAARRPAGRISAELEDQIVAARKWLWDVRLDGGSASVWSLLTDQGVVGVPSEATIWRVFVRRGQIVPPAAETSERDVHAVRSRTTERVLADRRDPYRTRHQ